MTPSLRLALIASATLASTALAASASAQPTPPSPVARERLWPQAYSDIAPDPQIVFGTMPNGMRYAIQHNDTPKGQVSLRLRIGAGSLNERDDQQGLAHVLEHMAFRGSTHAPTGDMMRILERLGLAFGADTNAFTGFDETVYQFDLPKNDAFSLSEGLLLMRDIGGDLLLQPQALAPERGVVLSEERLRDTPDFESSKADFAFELPGQLAPERMPIGKVDVIRDAPVSLIRQFYEANYRPDDATLIVTGDVDPAAVEQQIKARFGDWRPAGPAAPAPDLGQPERRGPQTHLFVRYGVSPGLSLVWVRPFDDTPDTVAKERREVVRNIALAALNRRYARLATGPNPPFLGAGASKGNEVRSAWIAGLSAHFRARDWRPALMAMVETQRQALAYGFSQAEIDREITEMTVAFRNAAAGAATRRTPALANELVREVNEEEVATSPAQDLALFQRFVAGLTVQEVDAALRETFEGSGPLLLMNTPEAPEGGEAALAAAFRQAEAAPLARPAALETQRWTHTDFGPAGRVVERRTVDDLGVTFVRFANGVRLTVKPTAFSKDQVQVAAYFGHGRLSQRKDRPSLDWAHSALISGGLTDLTIQDLEQVLADKTYSMALSTDDDAYLLHGVTRPKDLDVQLQVLAAYMTAPGWRLEAFDRVKEALGVALRQAPATPQGVQALTLATLSHSGDQRWALPTLDQLRGLQLSDLQAEIVPALQHGQIEVVVVGDISVDQAIAQVAATFGALPARAPEPVAPGEDLVRFPAPTPMPVVRLHEGRPDQGEAYIAWPTTDFWSDPDRARRLTIAARVLNLRLVDKVRIAEGATYSPSAGASESDTFPGYGLVFAGVEIPPSRAAGFYTDTSAIAEALRTRGVTADELSRAVRPHVEDIQKAQQTNGYWLGMLHRAQVEPRRLTLIRDTIPGYQRMTVQDVDAVARQYLRPETAWRYEVAPASVQGAAGAATKPAG